MMLHIVLFFMLFSNSLSFKGRLYPVILFISVCRTLLFTKNRQNVGLGKYLHASLHFSGFQEYSDAMYINITLILN